MATTEEAKALIMEGANSACANIDMILPNNADIRDGDIVFGVPPNMHMNFRLFEDSFRDAETCVKQIEAKLLANHIEHVTERYVRTEGDINDGYRHFRITTATADYVIFGFAARTLLRDIIKEPISEP